MNTSNWAEPRSQILDVAIIGLRRGYYLTVAEAAERLTLHNYRGLSPAIAEALLRRDLTREYYQRHGGQSERTEQILTMAADLHAEGWSYIQSHRDSAQGFWRHRSGADVNQNGGAFSSFGEATVKTYNSQSRELINRRTYA